MQGKRSIYLLLTVLVVLNLVATNLQAREIRNSFQAHAESGTPVRLTITGH